MKDLIIIGAGPGGYELAIQAAKHGLSTVLIEEDQLGGTCLNHGCIPTKSFYHAASVLRDFQTAADFGITGSCNLDFSLMLQKKNRIVSELRDGIRFMVEKSGAEMVFGHGKLLSKNQVEVNGTVIEGKTIVLATGSSSARLPLPGFNLPNVITSKEMLELDFVPKKLAVIGAGVIGIEFASIFSRFGSQVEVFEALEGILPVTDKEISKRLLSYLKASGIKFHLNAMVSRVEEDNGLKLWYTEKGQEDNASADVILVAVGRKPNLGNLGLDAAGILYDRRGIKVDANFKTNLDNVYAIGDVTGQMMLAHSATYSGYQVLKNLLGETERIDFFVLPSCVFTFPEVASVGLTEDEAAGKDYKVNKAYFRANGKAATMGEADGFIKIISVSGLIKGVHILGPHASDLISEAVALINKKTSAKEFKDFIHPHPTLGEIFTSALRD